jgi:hypothetical protein
MRWRIPIVAVFALFVVTSCEQQPVDPIDEHAVAEAPSFDWMNNPDNGNEKVYRSYEDFIICIGFDNAPDLRACHSNIPLGDGTETDCGLQQAEAPTSYQDVGTLNEDNFFDNDFRKIQKGDVWVTIRDLSQPGDCFGDALVAEGWAKFVGTDNDIFGSGDDPHTNSWSNKFEGKLMTPGGDEVSYSAMGQHLWSVKKGFRAFHKVNLH